MLRSGATYEETCGHHILSQGGYYQYEAGIQAAYRDPLQHVLPLIWADPELTRETIRYSATEQRSTLGFLPYSLTEMCRPSEHGTSADLDLWLLLAAAEYGLATRDLPFFGERLRWANGGRASLWSHLRHAYRNQESRRGPHGGYLTGTNGDWSDFSTPILGMDESILVTAQLAYVYPRLAELAELRGDRRFAAALRADAAELRAVLRREWTGRGWYSRGYGANGRIGQGAIFGEPQPWALLAGVPDRRQARTLVANVRRFLTGVGAPPQTHGPARIGSSQSPARNDPDVSERTSSPLGIGDNNAVYVGGAWYAINGWLTWALGELDGEVPRARELRVRRVPAQHARPPTPGRTRGTGTASSRSTTSATRTTRATRPAAASASLDGWNTQIMHQPSWSLFAALKLAGLDPVRDGYRIDPHLPMRELLAAAAGRGHRVPPRPCARLPAPARAGAAADDRRAAARPGRAVPSRRSSTGGACRGAREARCAQAPLRRRGRAAVGRSWTGRSRAARGRGRRSRRRRRSPPRGSCRRPRSRRRPTRRPDRPRRPCPRRRAGRRQGRCPRSRRTRCRAPGRP